MRRKLDKLKQAELELLEISKRFALHPQDRNREIEVHDTWIPRISVPLKIHSDASYPVDKDNSDEHYLIHGLVTKNENAEEKTPLVLLHGYLNGGAYFYRNLRGLSHFFQRIHAIDMLGWGLSSRPKFQLLEKSTKAAEDFFVESLEAWRKMNQIDRMILGGHSMGGYLAVAYCERFPERVEKLILISPVGVPHESEEAIEMRKARLNSSLQTRAMAGFYGLLYDQLYSIGDIARALPTTTSRSYIERYVTHRMPSIVDVNEQKAITDYLYENASLPGSGEYVLHYTLGPFAYAKQPLLDRIPKLKVSKISFLYGVSDWMDPVGGLQVRELKSSHQSIDVYSVSNSGHLLMLENPNEFNAALVLSADMDPSRKIKEKPNLL